MRKQFSASWVTVLALTAASLFGAAAHAATIVTPDGFANMNGESRDPNPFRLGGAGGSRGQVVYGSDFFHDSGGPIKINSISFRQHAGGLVTNRSRSFSDTSIQLSTTARSENNLSQTFADNVGADAATVYTGPLNFASTNANPQPQDFEFTVDFGNTPFIYDPSQGNLLLDVTVPTDATVVGANFSSLFDSVNDANDGVAAVGDINNGDARTGVIKTAPVTQFSVTPVPEPASIALLGGLGLLTWGRGQRRRGG